MAITRDEYFRGHGTPPDNIEVNARGLLVKVNALLADPECPFPGTGCRSGWRPADYNATIPGAAKNSKHITGHAIDLDDDDSLLDDWVNLYDSPDLRNNVLLERYGLYREHPASTKGWIHLQDLPPNSGRRTFYP